jgi:dipeptidyl aminopeptidase/acylaminoacyl peptidase
MSYLAPVDGVLNVWVGATGTTEYRPVTHDEDRGVRVYAWAHDNRHIIYLQDKGGDENWRLYRVDPESGDEKLLTPFDDVQVQIIQHDKHHPHELLIGMNKEDPKAHDVYHLDLRSGGLTLVAKNPGEILQWVPDADLSVRAAVASRPDGGADLLVRQSNVHEWETAIRWDSEDALTSGPVTFTRDGRALYLQDSRGANAARLVRWSPQTNECEIVAEDPQYDVSGVLVHPDTYEPQLVSFVRARREWLVLDHSLHEDIEAIRALHHGDFAITNRTDADDTWVTVFDQDVGSASYYVFDRSSRTGHFLFYTRPDLARYQLAAMEPISFVAQDGLMIHGYLATPPGLERSHLPMVLLVHGGPWHRDTWGYDPEVQWLTNRGYAVLQVNFRGSTGYGKEFLNAGDREWGAKMHADLVDAVRWAVDGGIADPHRIAIYGGSYGGYAALVGATFTPDLFRCAVDIVGPSNLITFINSIPPYWSAFLSMLHERVGNPDHDADFLQTRSPLFHVDRIKIPLLIAQGANDPRVKRAEAEQIVTALREKDIDHEYLLFPDEGHGFAKPENRLAFYAAAERFLAKHLGGRCEADD